MNGQAISTNPFFTVALPLMITFVVSSWSSAHASNKRIDDLRDAINQLRDSVDKRFDGVDRRLDKIDARLDRIETKLDSHGERIAKLEGPALVRQ